MSDSNGFLVGSEIFKKTEFNAKFHMVLKQADQTWMKKVLKISQMSLDISPKLFLTSNLPKLGNIFVGLRPASDLKLFFDALGVLAAVRLCCFITRNVVPTFIVLKVFKCFKKF